MSLTPEQNDIIELSKRLKNNEILSIQACAGSGKTYTLKQIANANPDKEYLYLAFNRAIVTEARSKFPKNVEVKTLHSLALNYTKKVLGDFSFVDNLTIFDLAKLYEANNDELITVLGYFNEFLRSDRTLESEPPFIKQLFEAVLDKELPMFHNFYLKYYALSMNKSIQLERKYDCILLDEAQDTNPVMLSIFLNNQCAKILVGDSFQNIYGFNNSINAFKIVKPHFKKSLSKSFRCKQEILDYANFFLQNFKDKDEQCLELESNAKRDTLFSQDKAFITRTNAGIIEYISTIEKDEENHFSLLKEPSKIFAPIHAILSFKNGNTHLIPKEYAYFKNFKSSKELYEYINKTQDKELISALNLLNKNLNLYELSSKARRLYENKNAQTYIINAHQAKGLEWDIVELHNDFPSLKDLQDDFEEKEGKELQIIKEKTNLEQERNLFYVAITRAKNELIDRSENRDFYVRNKNSNSFVKKRY